MKCSYGTGMQEIETCRMIYIHWPGYYPDGLFRYALENLCPNFDASCTGCPSVSETGR
jgi:hypothetical protein